ncbi:hypothetical protein KCP69_18300 [Salmonella enterica subsp. enterica]|nr:hypothetical protein KCP69_18300 [Salmonella enterica subsp. enterica]
MLVIAACTGAVGVKLRVRVVRFPARSVVAYGRVMSRFAALVCTRQAPALRGGYSSSAGGPLMRTSLPPSS